MNSIKSLLLKLKPEHLNVFEFLFFNISLILYSVYFFIVSTIRFLDLLFFSGFIYLSIGFLIFIATILFQKNSNIAKYLLAVFLIIPEVFFIIVLGLFVHLLILSDSTIKYMNYVDRSPRPEDEFDLRNRMDMINMWLLYIFFLVSLFSYLIFILFKPKHIVKNDTN